MQNKNPDNPLIEPSFAEALAAIERANELSLEKGRHWACSLRVIAKALGRPPALVPARWTAVRYPIGRLHHAPLGVTAKTLANHKANVRTALAWLAQEEEIPSRGAPLSPEWEELRERIDHYRTRANLSSLMRFCSARGIAPAAVDETVIDDLLEYRARTTALASDAAARRRIARAWNGCIGTIAGWPPQRLEEPPARSTATGPAWEAFPAGLRHDIEAYLETLTSIRRSASGRRRLPCKASTIQVRRAKLAAFARKAVALGTPIDSFASLAALLDPDLVTRVLDAYWQENGDVPSIYTIELAAMLAGIARETGCGDAAAIARLDDMRATLDEFRPMGLTEKNLALIRQVLTPGVWRSVVRLPDDLMRQAREMRDRAPVKAAGLAQRAVAIAILTVMPVRLGNLAAIRLGENLIRPHGPEGSFWLVFPDHDVKNRVRLENPLDEGLTALLDEYIDDHLHVLARGSNEPFLFPGAAGGHKGCATLSNQVTDCVQQATGLRVTVHQFRHAAAALILDAHPGNYEYVRRILGHKNIQTTINFYVGLETAQAARLFGELVRGKLDFDPEPV